MDPMTEERKIEGVLILPLDQQDDTELRIDPAGVELPAICPVTIGFSLDHHVGTATLMRGGDMIRATVTLYGDGIRKVETLAGAGCGRYLAASVEVVETSPEIRAATVTLLRSIALVDRHVDAKQPIWRWVEASVTHLLGPTGVVCGYPAHAHLDHGWSKDLASVTCGDCAMVGDSSMALTFHGLRPRIVCLCGSTRFSDAYREANLRETLAGKIVLSIGCDTRSDADLAAAGELGQDLDATKAMLDELHLRKIDLADEVLVVSDATGYYGDSTAREIAYADKHGVPVRFLRAVDLVSQPPPADVDTATVNGVIQLLGDGQVLAELTSETATILRDMLTDSIAAAVEQVGGETSSEGYPCPSCGQPTQYAAFSGGAEYECLHCGNQGAYPDDAPGLPRATLLRTVEGRAQLWRDMREELARRAGERGNLAPEWVE